MMAIKKKNEGIEITSIPFLIALASFSTSGEAREKRPLGEGVRSRTRADRERPTEAEPVGCRRAGQKIKVIRFLFLKNLIDFCV